MLLSVQDSMSAPGVSSRQRNPEEASATARSLSHSLQKQFWLFPARGPGEEAHLARTGVHVSSQAFPEKDPRTARRLSLPGFNTHCFFV